MYQNGTYYFRAKGCSKEEFLRKAYIELYSSMDAPETIDSVEFTPVYEDTIFFVKQQNTFNIRYTMEIGYKRQEQYVEYISRYDSTLKRNVSEPVIKYRTVTDWQPFQSEANGLKELSYSFWGENLDPTLPGSSPAMAALCQHRVDYTEAVQVADAADLVDAEDLAGFPPPLTDAEKETQAESVATNSNFYGHLVSTFPGDENRNFHARWALADSITGICGIRRYQVGFKFEGKEGLIRMYEHLDDPEIRSDYISDDHTVEDLEKSKQTELETDEGVQQAAKIHQYATWGGYGLGALLLILSMITGVMGLFVASVIILVAAYFVTKYLKGQLDDKKAIIIGKYDHQINDFKSGVQAKKIPLLQNRFAQLGWSAPTPQELERFGLDHEHDMKK